MGTDQFYIRLSLRYGLLGALVFPFIYESYANIMHSFAVLLAAAGCIFAGVKFSQFKPAQALGAAVCFIVLSCGLGAFAELMVHDYVVSFLEKRSKYFYMSYKEIMVFVVCIFVCYILMFIICILKIGITAAIKSIDKNSEIADSLINNAFGDDDE